MDITTELVEAIAIDRIISDLCLKYYMEQNPVIKEAIFNEIILFHNNINKNS